MLAVVQHQKHALGAEGCQKCRPQGAAWRFTHTEYRRDRLRHEYRVRQRGQVHQPDPVREVLDLLGGHLK